MISHLLRASAALFLALTAGAQEPTAAVGAIRGATYQKLIAGESSRLEPLAYATVRLMHQGTGRRDLYVCGREGHFTFADLAPGTYRLEARLEGYRTARREVRVGTGGVSETELVLVPGIDVEETLARLRAEDYESLIYHVFSPQGRSFRLELALSATEGRMRLSEEISQVGDGAFERKMADEDLARLRELLDRIRPLQINHRGSYARPPDLPYETLEMAAAGVLGIVVVSGNPDFEEAPGRELIELLYSLSSQVIRRLED